MYNMLFGVNPAFPILLKALNLIYHGKTLNIKGKYDPGRFRDIYLSGEGDKILLYTRNGGGNRDCWEEDGCPNFDSNTGKYLANGRLIDSRDIGKPENHDPSCLVYVNWHLQQHPLYITDYDDDFDCTYATFEFRVPDSLQPILDKLMEAQGGAPVDVSTKFNALVAEMGKMTPEQVRADPRFKPLIGIVEQIGEAAKNT